MASHVCDTWQAMCVTHGMPCVNMHGTLRAINRRAQIRFVEAANSVRGGSSKEEEEKGRKGEEKGRKGKEKRKGGKGKKRGKRKRKRKEGCAVSIPDKTQPGYPPRVLQVVPPSEVPLYNP